MIPIKTSPQIFNTVTVTMRFTDNDHQPAPEIFDMPGKLWQYLATSAVLILTL